ncbi:LysM peptidoglycan-binding domain-containing protein [Pseudophaeobacter sp.]|uniref:LysM peptidoglycan-binding domain-containing protein n=1 Tax=Pseudophaeobacter sp. TaxID=1971739 RepID=UPI003296AF0A
MAGTGVAGGLSGLALGGAVATVVVVGGATMAWLGVFDGNESDPATRDEVSNTIAISPSANPPKVIQGVSQEPDPVESQAEAVVQPQQEGTQAEPQQETPGASASEPEVAADATSDTAAVEAEAGEIVAETAPAASPSDGSVDDSEAAQVAALAVPQEEDTASETPLFDAPLLDLVRVGPTGETVIAGRATTGVLVEVLLDGEVVEQVEVPAGGDFVAFTDLPPSRQARVISLRASAEGQVRLSDSSFIVAPATPVASSAQPEATDLAQATSEAETPNAAETSASEEAATTEAGSPDAEISSDETVQLASTTSDAAVSTPTEEVIAEAELQSSDAPEVAEALVSETESAAELTTAPETVAETPLSNVPEGVASAAPETTAPAAVVAAPETTLVADATTDLAEPQATTPGQAEKITELETKPAPQPQPAQVAVLRADAEGVTLVQPIAQKPQGKVVLDTISYSDSGEVQLAGRAGAASNVLVYLDNAPAGQFAAAENGSWGGRLEAVTPGVYTLRLDEVDTAGKVLSRLETPFKREAPEVLQPPVSEGATGEAAPLVRAVTVQEGDTLWAISQQRYGSGYLYVRVFEANNSAIRDPDLIYPGQVFALPE